MRDEDPRAQETFCRSVSHTANTHRLENSREREREDETGKRQREEENKN